MEVDANLVIQVLTERLAGEIREHALTKAVLLQVQAAVAVAAEGVSVEPSDG